MRRIAAQMPAEEKARRADFVDSHRRHEGESTDRQVESAAGCASPTSVRERGADSDSGLDAASDSQFLRLLRRRDPIFHERVPLVAVRALPQQLGAAIAAAHADVRDPCRRRRGG